MSNWVDWQEFRDSTEVCERDGRFYLKSHPEYLYETYEEAFGSSELLRSMVAF